MEGGQSNKKIAFIIQARMKSTRLPGKILLPIPLGGDKTLLSWILDELNFSEFDNKIIVASSTNTENDILEAFCKNKVEIFRGNEEDVLSRFISIAKRDNYNCVVRLTADNPVIDIKILDDTIKYHFFNNNDYTNTVGLPIGMNFEVIAPDALISLENCNLNDSDREHVTLFIKNNSQFKKGEYVVSCEEIFKDFRLTVDYSSDYTLLSSIFSQINNNVGLRGIELIKVTYSKFPWLFESNSFNFQKRQFPTINLEIKEAHYLLDQFELKNASEILKKHLES